MCSPSRATLLTGRYPAQHGVTLTHTQADLRPDPRNRRPCAATLAGHAARARTRRAGGRFAASAAGLLQLGPKSGGEPELRPDTPNLAQLLRGARLRGRLQGQVAPDPPLGRRRRCSAAGRHADAERLRDDYGFADWEPPDAGENAKAEHFGAGNAGPLGAGLGRGLHAAGRGAGSAAPTCRSRSASSSRSSTRTTCSAIRPSTSAAATREIGVPRPRRASCRRRWTRTCATSPPSTS